MTESPGNEPGSMLFPHILQMASEHGVDIRHHLDGNALRLEFADGQRILVNLDIQTRKVWLAARTGGIEFMQQNGDWRASDGSELFTRLAGLIESTIASNPVNARAVPAYAQTAAAPPAIRQRAERNHGPRNTLLVVLAVLCGVWSIQRLGRSAPAEASAPAVKTQTLSLNKLHYPCEGGLPANGSITLFPDSALRAGAPEDPEITLQNEHTHPVLLILSPPQTAIPSLSVLVHAKQVTSLHLPAGRYDMMFSAGSHWCNPRSGFTEGSLLKFDKPLTVDADKPVRLSVQTSGSGIGDLKLFVKTPGIEASLPPPTFSGDGSMQVQRQADGHFYLPGSIGNIPATFMVDTGASVTSISADLAHQIGIRNCKEVQFKTANGETTGCIALVPHMMLGRFALENITVAVMPELETNLLGANVLRNFEVNQNDSSMLIGRH